MSTAAEGGCLCGAVRYRVEGDPVAATLCHCASCRRAGGGPTLAWAVFDRERVVWLAGEPQEYESSPGKFWNFCARCGSLVGYCRASRPEHYDITIATLDNPDAFPPTVEIWTGEKVGWEALNEAIPHKPRSSLNE